VFGDFGAMVCTFVLSARGWQLSQIGLCFLYRFAVFLGLGDFFLVQLK